MLVHLVPAAASEGPYAVTTGEYRFTDRSEPLVATDRKIDLWAEVYRPKDLGKKPFPLAVLLHGNHATCGRYDPKLEVRVDDRIDYTTTGKCPKDYVVVPSHLGYDYFAGELASWGYVVVSINADRGINAGDGIDGDAGLNLMRGRLILRHLALLSGWNRGSGPIPPPVTLGYNPVGTMDFAETGLMGHSRGGEGARAALQQFRDKGSPFPPLIPDLKIHSIFEIGPVDGQTSRVLDANGVNSIILLPACDGDVSDLEGMHVFDRVFMQPRKDERLLFHGTAFVWGANHNSYNTQWQQSDSPGCDGTYPIFQQNGTSKPQQVTSREMVVPFFRATVGAKANGTLAARFDPTRLVPSAITDITNIERGYLPAPIGADVRLLETFSKDTGTSDGGVPTKSAGVTVVHQAASYEHQQGTRVATVSWTPASPPKRFFQVDFRPGLDVSPYAAFSFRTALRCYASVCNHTAKNTGEMAYTVSLVDSNGQMSNAYPTRGHVRISRPIGDEQSNLHSTLYTVEIPLSAFRGVTTSQIKGVRFTFEDRPQGVVDITDLALEKTDPLLAADSTSIAAAAPQGAPSFALAAAADDGNAISIVRPGTGKGRLASQSAAAGGASVDIVLTSKRAFPVTDAFPALKIGGDVLRGGSIGPDGKRLTFSVPAAQFDKLAGDVSLSILTSAPAWQFGSLPK